MEEYVKHVKDERTSNIQNKDITFCGEPIMEWAFTGPSHVVANIQANGRLLPCEKCKEKIIELLNNVS